MLGPERVRYVAPQGRSRSQRLLDPAALARSRSCSYHDEKLSELMMSLREVAPDIRKQCRLLCHDDGRSKKLNNAAQIDRPMLKRPFKVAATAKLSTFLPRDVERIKDTFSEDRIMSSCVTPLVRKESSHVVLLHGFDREAARMGVKQALRSIDAFPRAE
ncbi:hypothetical protein F2Q69_00019614 [Brassica cretica]|uniref:Uncharacterized protein n=1 Tax=Brassica cretica TaxID=69181 RepID=A0A8S9QNJ4_BRACR|nr:hypothetical protein F2Q69_00019614 [Brassica cretica]